MPRHSRYMAAVADDDELAEKFLDLDDGSPPSPLGFYEWTPERDLLTHLVEAVSRLHAWQVGVHSRDHKVPKVPPLPRPRSALDRVRARREEEQVAAIVAAFRPRD
jgi:hypothetical protein